MPSRLAKTYELRAESQAVNGRPCWVQKVRNSTGLYIFSQACKPGEKGFPHVESMLISVSAEGELTEYCSDEVLGFLTEVRLPRGEKRRAIEWTDGTNVTWIETIKG